MPEMAVSESSMDWNKTGSWRSSTPLHKNITPPCNFNCPAGENIRGYIDLLKDKKTKEAFELLTEANPFPAVCGRVCYHPCQASCNRSSLDREINVRKLERFIGDWGMENVNKQALPPTASKKIAIIGAGPAGLSAAFYLRKQGIAVTVYDENSMPGGILRYGIPSYRLEKDVLAKELDRVLHGIEFKSNMRFGSDFDISDLLGFDAVFLATGAHLSKTMNIDGENIPEVESGLNFLKTANSNGSGNLKGKEVIVVGGGNTACDTARSAYRFGAKVTLVYRRTEAQMPAFAEEIEQLKKEPIKIEFLTAPKNIRKTDGGKLGVTFIKMKLGLPDSSGRSRPVPIADSDFEMSVDKIFTAIGEDPDLSFFGNARIKTGGEFDFSDIDERLKARLFVGGDILPNPRTVPHAVGSGRLASEKIAAFLKGEVLTQSEDIEVIAGPGDINFDYFSMINLTKRGSHPAESGFANMDEASSEAARCFSCGVCDHCDNCHNFCPDMAVIKTSNGYHVNLEYCKGCGICARECPRGSLKMDGTE